MQTLGLASEQKPSDGMLKRLFWPTIENQYDVDLIGVQGFWLCMVVATLSMVVSAIAGSPIIGLLLFATYTLGGMGVRERDLFAAIFVFFAYLLDRIVAIESSVLGLGSSGNPLLGMVALMLLLANVRGTVLARKSRNEGVADELASDEERPVISITEKMANKLPAAVWPKGRFVFYPLVGIVLLLTILSMVGLPFLANKRATALQQQRNEQIETTLPVNQ